MPRGPKKLNDNQVDALAYVHLTDERWREARRNALARAKLLAEEEIKLHASKRDQAVFEAVEKGVPYSRISGSDGLHTSPNAAYEIYNRMVADLAATSVDLVSRPGEELDARFSGYIVGKFRYTATVGVKDAQRKKLRFDDPRTWTSTAKKLKGVKVNLVESDGVWTATVQGDDPDDVLARDWALKNWEKFPELPPLEG